MANDTLLLLLVALVFLALFIAGSQNIDLSEKRAKYAQALLTLMALVTTAYWFFLERKGLPHADVTQSVQVVPLGNDLIAVEAHVQIKNIGQRLLRIDRINSRLQLVRADAYDYENLNRLANDDYWTAARPNSDALQFHAGELRWPIFRQYRKSVDHRIEPGETDLIVVTFLMNCSLSDQVRVASDVYNPAAANSAGNGSEESEAGEGIAWKTRSFADLSQACPQQEGGEHEQDSV